MKKRLITLLVVTFIGSFVFGGLSFAEVKTAYGGALRLRHELWENMFDTDNQIKDNRSMFRIKTSLWGSLGVEDIGIAQKGTLYVKLTHEAKPHTYYMATSAPNNDKGIKGDFGEGVFDNLYVDLNGFLDLPLDLRLGRQDFLGTYGEGFLIMDGTPIDGSRTFYFNAAKAAWKINDTNTLDMVYMYQPKTDDLLPIIDGNNRESSLVSTDEQGYMLYLKNTDIENLTFEPYYIFKQEDSGGSKLQTNASQINTIGSFAKYKFPFMTLRGQAAMQTGEYGDKDREGFGGYIFADKNFEDKKMKPGISLGYMYLSGDDPDSDAMEAWDPLFSKWPWMSELYVVNYAAESGLGYWTNLQMLRAQLSLKPCNKTKVTLFYNYLMANENVTGSYYADGNGRGHLPQLRLDYTINDKISTYFLAEYLMPGNFYSESSQDNALFLRTEVSFKF